MEDAGRWEPAVEDRAHRRRRRAVLLAATAKRPFAYEIQAGRNKIKIQRNEIQAGWNKFQIRRNEIELKSLDLLGKYPVYVPRRMM